MKLEQFKEGDRIAVYGTHGRGVDQVIKVHSNLLETVHHGLVHPKQVRKIKTKKLELGTQVYVLPSWSKWFLDHLDIYYIPGSPHKFKEEDYQEIRARLSQVIDNYKVLGEIVGYGDEGSYRVAFKMYDIDFSTYIGREDLEVLK